MQKSESIANLAKALAAFQSEIQNPKNTADNPFYSSKYAPLHEVLNIARPLLAKHGLSVLQSPSGNGAEITISSILMHSSGEWIEPDPLVLKADKPTAQGAGSAITYGRRYSISAILGISSEDDDDGNGAEPKQDKPQGKPGTLSEKQVNRAYAIAKEAGISAEDVDTWVHTKYKKEIKALTKLEYDALCKALEAKKGEGK